MSTFTSLLKFKYLKIFIPIVSLLAIGYAFSLKYEKPAIKFIESLSDEQWDKAYFDFDIEEREEWDFVPVLTKPRPGIQLSELNNKQEDLLFKLVRSYLSKSGYEKTKQIISLEEVLAEISGDTEYRDPEKYHAAFYGDPRKDDPWSWSFEGHHVSLNFTVVDGKISMTPRFFGANPAIVPSGSRKGERTLKEEEDLGLQLINMMSASKRKKAIFEEEAFPDNVTGVLSKVNPLEPVGVSTREMTEEEIEILDELIHVYLSSMPEKLAEKRRKNIEIEDWDEIHFGWAGETDLGEPHYYRVQGKTFLIEFDNTQNDANHIHTVWRDFDGDFGRDLIKEHYESSDHHDHPHPH